MSRLLLCFPLLSLLFLPGCGSSNSGSGSQPTPPPPGLSSFAHVVVIIQENRTPDNLFQSMVASGADISSNGICHVGTAPCAGADSNGVLSLSPTPLAITYDLGHDYNAWTIDFHAGAMDHFNGGGCSGGPCPINAPYHYVQASDIQPYIQLAQTYAFADRMFQSNKGPSIPGHLYLSWGTSRLGSGSTVLGASNSAGYCAFPSPNVGTWTTLDQQSGATGTSAACMESSNLITDQLEAKQLTWKYYVASSPNSAIFGWAPAYMNHICCGVSSPLTCPSSGGCQATEYTSHVNSSPNTCSGSNCTGQILNDIASCNLPSVAWVTPSGLTSDHPLSTDGSGPSWVAAIVNAIGTSPCNSGNWNDTATILTWDDWGGFYDHVSPDVQAGYAGLPPAPNSAYPIPQSAGPTSTYNSYMYGFRVPLIVISRYARPGVSHVTHDFGSILTFIEHNFGLSQMGDASSGTTSTTWNADGLAAARGDFLMDMFNYNGNIGFTTVSRLEHFRPIDAPLPPEWFLAAKPNIKYPAIDTDMDDELLTHAQLAAFERVRQHYIHVVRTAIHEQEIGVKRLTLQQSLSSTMPSGTKFTAIDITARVFAGHIITHPASHQTGNGSLVLAFDGPVIVLTYGHEHVVGAKLELSSMNASTTRLKLSCERTDIDSDSGTYLCAAPPDGATAMLVRRNGDVKLPKGQPIEVKLEKRKQS